MMNTLLATEREASCGDTVLVGREKADEDGDQADLDRDICIGATVWTHYYIALVQGFSMVKGSARGFLTL